MVVGLNFKLPQTIEPQCRVLHLSISIDCSYAHHQVRDELEHLLNDDGDMAEMYLTEKFQQSLEDSSTSSINERDDTDDEEFQSAIDDRHVIILLTFMI